MPDKIKKLLLMMKLSIIIPVYNVKPYLRECLESVRLQTCGDWECICINDGSSDGSGDILDEYSKLDSRYVVVHQPNQGVSAARNAGLEIAKGEWIGFLDGDDIWSPYAVSILLESVQKYHNADVVAFGVREFSDNEPLIRWVNPSNLDYEVIDMRSEYPLRQETSMFFWGKLYRRDKIIDKHFPPYRNGEDLVFLFSALLDADYMVILPCQLYGYRQHEGSSSRNLITNQRLHDYLDCTMDISRLLSGARKQVDKKIIRVSALGITEGFMLKLSRREQPLPCYADVWERWKLCLSEFIKEKRLSGFRKVCVKIFLSFPIYPIAWTLFYVPVWLKTKGLHR